MERMKRSRLVATCFVFFIAMLALIGVFATTGIGRSNKPAEAATTYTLNITITNATTDIYADQALTTKHTVSSVRVSYGDASTTINGKSGSATLVSTTGAGSIGFTLYYSSSGYLNGSRNIGSSESVSGQNTECTYNTGYPGYILYKGKLAFDRNNINIPFPQVVINQPTEFEDVTKKQQREAHAFVTEQKELSKGIAEGDTDNI